MKKQLTVISLKSARAFARSIFILFLLLLTSGSGAAEASVGGSVSFKWRANPPEDYVIGYRLYYGESSRFNSNGASKANFSYDYYIDFAEQERCEGGSNGTECMALNSTELDCRNLYGDVPQCTVSKLHGLLYFALTAYNAQTESNFTKELYVAINHVTDNQRGMAAAQVAISTLLLK